MMETLPVTFQQLSPQTSVSEGRSLPGAGWRVSEAGLAWAGLAWAGRQDGCMEQGSVNSAAGSGKVQAEGRGHLFMLGWRADGRRFTVPQGPAASSGSIKESGQVTEVTERQREGDTLQIHTLHTHTHTHTAYIHKLDTPKDTHSTHCTHTGQSECILQFPALALQT